MPELQDDIVPSLYAASRQGIVPVAVDDGEAAPLPFLLNGVPIRALLVDAKGVLLAAATGDRGVQTTRDGGRTFRAAAGLDAGEVRVLARRDRLVLAGSGASATLYRSDDGGQSFQALALKVPAAALAPSVTGIVLSGERLAVAVDVAGVFRSDDGGRTFRDVTGVLPRPLLGLWPGEKDALWAGTGDGLHVLEGGAWRSLLRARGRGAVTALARDPLDPRRLLAGIAATVRAAKPGVPAGADAWITTSADGGATWREVATGILPVIRGSFSRFVFAGKAEGRVFAGTSAGEIFESRDRGLTWRLAVGTLSGVLDLVPGPALGPALG